MRYEFLNDDSEYDDEFGRGTRKQADPRLPRKMKQRTVEVMSSLVKTADGAQVSGNGFDPTYKGSKHERQWIADALGGFYDDNLWSHYVSLRNPALQDFDPEIHKG